MLEIERPTYAVVVVKAAAAAVAWAASMAVQVAFVDIFQAQDSLELLAQMHEMGSLATVSPVRVRPSGGSAIKSQRRHFCPQ